MCCRPVYKFVLRKIIHARTGGDAFHVSRFPPIKWRRRHRPLPPLQQDVVLSNCVTAQLQRGQTGKTTQAATQKKKCLRNMNITKQKRETQTHMIMSQVWHFDFYSCHMTACCSILHQLGVHIFSEAAPFHHLFAKHLHVSLHPDGFGCVQVFRYLSLCLRVNIIDPYCKKTFWHVIARQAKYRSLCRLTVATGHLLHVAPWETAQV